MFNFTNETTATSSDAPNATAGPDNFPLVGMSGSVRFVYLTIGTLGLLGNCLVVCVIFFFTSMHKKLTNLFIVHQSVIDMITSLVLVIFTLTTGQYYIPGFLGELICRVWINGYIMWNTFVTSSFNLLALTIERYLGIVYPILHRIAFTRTKAFIMMAVSWLLGPIINLFNPLTTALDSNNKCLVAVYWPNAETRRATGILQILAKYFVPILIMMYCYGHIIYALRVKLKIEPHRDTATDPPPTINTTQPHANRKNKAMKNVITTLIIVSLCFVFCWSWNQFFYLLANLGVAVRFDTAFYQFSVIAVFSNCCINPIIYIAKYAEFRTAVHRLFCLRLGRVAPASSVTGTSN